MGKVIAGITTSVDGYIAGPNDGPGKGLGEGGERLHYWVFGGPWTYDAEPTGEMLPEDKGWMEQAMANVGAVVGGRATYEAAEHWGDTNPWGLPFFIVTHRPEEQPPGGHFMFVSGVADAIEQAKEAAGGMDVHVMGGADVIRRRDWWTSLRSSSRRSSSAVASGCSTASTATSSSSTSACASRGTRRSSIIGWCGSRTGARRKGTARASSR
jgi:dihydrofolate reductase